VSIAGFPLALAWAAIWEEIVFRGWLQPAIGRRFGASQWPWLAMFGAGNLMASIAFASMHLPGHPMALWPGYLCVSLLLGVARDRSGGVALPMALHLAFNLAWWACDRSNPG
jgi:membrane protease YdiL (CAAX protease family)